MGAEEAGGAVRTGADTVVGGVADTAAAVVDSAALVDSAMDGAADGAAVAVLSLVSFGTGGSTLFAAAAFGCRGGGGGRSMMSAVAGENSELREQSSAMWTKSTQQRTCEIGLDRQSTDRAIEHVTSLNSTKSRCSYPTRSRRCVLPDLAAIAIRVDCAIEIGSIVM